MVHQYEYRVPGLSGLYVHVYQLLQQRVIATAVSPPERTRPRRQTTATHQRRWRRPTRKAGVAT